MSLTLKVARSRTPRAGPGVGDPGLFGFIGSAIGKMAGIAKNIPGPIGWAGTAVSKLTTNPSGVSLQPSFRPAQLPPFPGTEVPGITGIAQRFFPGGETGVAPPVGAPSGYHVNKTGYWRHDEAGEWQYIPKESRWVKNRRRNPLNPRAASKAIGRIESLKKATSRFSRITIRKKCCK